MSHDSATPDRADKADADDLDIPTFNPAADGPTDPYKKVGRAAPQEIRPREAAPAEEKTPPAEEKKADRSAPLLSDAPTATFDRPEPPEAPKAPKTEPEPRPEATTPAPATAVTRVERRSEIPGSGEQSVSSPSAPAYAGAAAPVVDETDEADREDAVEARRGTLDLGLLILRLGLGGWLILHSLSVFFHLGGSAGLSGLEGQYAAYAAPQALAVAIPATGLAAGVFILLGLITPLFAVAATVVTGFMAADALAHSGAGLDVFSWPEDIWLYVILGTAALAVQFTGPGRYALDFSRGWARRPLASSWLGLVLAAVGLGVLWWFGAGVNPLA
ncbi:DoxX family membrane protein [Corynebacterium oculi]|uniref:DoxX n=1 Tax=Corynebacterium oculi TaxID=1544416 RepID=A0A0N8VZG5_9CORY|nr:DoxX family membrane protein [Corynebacterium oculi]KQB83834.1 DoxX [Corynebacterium oculi]